MTTYIADSTFVSNTFPGNDFAELNKTNFPDMVVDFDTNPCMHVENSGYYCKAIPRYDSPYADGFIRLSGDYSGIRIYFQGYAEESDVDIDHALNGQYGTCEYDVVIEPAYRTMVEYDSIDDINRIFNKLVNIGYIADYYDETPDEFDEDDRIDAVCDFFEDEFKNYKQYGINEVAEFKEEFRDRSNAYIDVVDDWATEVERIIVAFNEQYDSDEY